METSGILCKLHDNWTQKYLPDSLEALRDMIQDNERRMRGESLFYAKTLVFVQSSGMGKSRLADAFGETCPMINFILREEGTLGYPPADGEVLSFLRKELSEETKTRILDTPKKKRMSSMRTPERDKRKIIDSPTSKKLKSSIRNQLPEENPKMAAEWPSQTETEESSQGPGKDESPRELESKEAEIFLESMATAIWHHSLAAGLLQASFEMFNAWFWQQDADTSLKELAAVRQKRMAPLRYDTGDMTDWNSRSEDRANFCRSIVSRAEQIADGLIQTKAWRHSFHDDRDSHVCVQLQSQDALKGLMEEAKKLIENLKRFRHNGDEPLMVFVFDEASSLLKLDRSGNLDPGLYHALNQIISCLKLFPMWFFFLSTESQVRMLMPANDEEQTGNYSYDPSARMALPSNNSLERFPPFQAFQLDVEDRKRMLSPAYRAEELSKSLDEFAAPEHMAMFGRPLWFGYDADEMNKLAKLKLVGGKQGTTYNAKDVHHVFAALSFRLSLDVCLQNPRTLPLSRTAVNSFMRVVVAMDQETGVMDTITPSEPVVAKAAMEHLCQKDNWSDSIRTLTEELLQNGLIDKGLKGELYSRFVLILAHDCLQVKASLRRPTFTVQQFLTALYAEDHHRLIHLLPPKILGARMNFNHFIPAGENLTPEVIPELLHDLLRRSAGMQLAQHQPTYDIMIPIYFGNPEEPFEVSHCGVIQLQVKNKNEATTPESIFNETFTRVPPGPKSLSIQRAADSNNSIRDGPYFVLNEMTNPVLFLLFDLGIVRKSKARSTLVEVSRSSSERNPVIWAIHSRGHDDAVFGCLRHMNCVDKIQKFFTSLMPANTTHNNLCQRNKVFSRLGRNFRYPGAMQNRGATRKRKDSKDDIEMENESEDILMNDV